MDTDIMYSTIDITLSEVQVYSEKTGEYKISGFGQEIIDTLRWSMNFFVYALEQLVLFTIRMIPVMIIVGIVIVILKTINKFTGIFSKIRLPKLFHRKKKNEVVNSDTKNVK